MTGAKRRTWVYLATAIVLFLIWSNSFIAASYLLGGERPAAQFTWDGLSTDTPASWAPSWSRSPRSAMTPYVASPPLASPSSPGTKYSRVWA